MVARVASQPSPPSWTTSTSLSVLFRAVGRTLKEGERRVQRCLTTSALGATHLIMANAQKRRAKMSASGSAVSQTPTDIPVTQETQVLLGVIATTPFATSLPVVTEVLRMIPTVPRGTFQPGAESDTMGGVDLAEVGRRLAALPDPPELRMMCPQASVVSEDKLTGELRLLYAQHPGLFTVPEQTSAPPPPPSSSSSLSSSSSSSSYRQQPLPAPSNPVVAVATPPRAVQRQGSSSSARAATRATNSTSETAEDIARTILNEFADAHREFSAKLPELLPGARADKMDVDGEGYVIEPEMVALVEDLYTTLDAVVRAKLLPKCSANLVELGASLEGLLAAIQLDMAVTYSDSQLETLEDEDRGHFDEVVAKLRVVQCLSLLFHTSADASLVPSEDRLIKVFDALQDLIANIIAPLGSATGKSMAKVDPAVGGIVIKLNSGLVALFQQFSDYFSNIELNELILGRIVATAQKCVEINYSRLTQASVELLCSLWRRERNRALISKDVLDDFDRWGQYTIDVVSGSAKDLHIVTGLLLKLMQTTAPRLQPVLQLDELEMAFSAQTSAVQYAMKFSDRASSMLIERWMTTKQDHHLKLLQTVVADAVNVLLSPEWPAAKLLLLSLVGKLLKQFQTSPDQTVEFRKTVIDLFGAVLQKLRPSHTKEQRKRAAALSSLDELEEIVGLLQKSFKYLRDIKHEHGGKEFVLTMLVTEVAQDTSVGSDVALSRYQQLLHLQTAQLDAGSQGNQSVAQIPVEAKEASTILTCRFNALFNLYIPMFEFILQSLADDKVNVRVSAMRVIKDLANDDPIVLRQDAVLVAIVNGLEDKQTSVRSQAFQIMSEHIKSDPALASTFMGIIQLKSQDPSLSIRKNVVALVKDLALQPNAAEDVCIWAAKLVTGLLQDEEESIRNESQKCLEEIFLSALPRKVADLRVGSLEQLPAAVQEVVSRRAAVLVNSLCDWEEYYLRGEHVFLHRVSLAGGSEQLAIFKLVIHGVVERALASPFVPENLQEEARQSIERDLETLVAVSDYFPDLVAPHVLDLCQAIFPIVLAVTSKSVLGQMQKILEHLCHVLFKAGRAVTVNERDATQLADWTQKLANKMLPEVVDEAVPAFSVICLSNGLHAKASAYFAEQHAKVTAKDPTNRAMRIFGLLLKHYEFDRIPPSNSRSDWAQSVHRELIACYRRRPEGPLNGWACELIGRLGWRLPNIISQDKEMLSFMENALKGTSNNIIIYSVLNVLLEPMAAEARRVRRTGTTANQQTSELEKLRAEIAQGFAQMYRDGVHDLVLHDAQEVRERALETLNYIIDQRTGYLGNLVPNTIAASSDGKDLTSRRAVMMLEKLFKESTSLTGEKTIKGMDAMFKYQSLNQDFIRELPFEPLYSVLVASSNSDRVVKIVLDALAKQFASSHEVLSSFTERSPSRVPIWTVALHAFVAKCLAQTLFKTIDEPKLILHHLSGLSRSAIELHTKLSADLPSSSAGQQPHPKNELDAALIDCIGLRLQGHLQLVYNLDERRQERFEESKFSSSYKRNVKGRQPERLRDVDLPLLDDILALAEAAAPGSDDALARSKRVVQLLHDELVKEHLIDADAMLVSPESSNPRRRRIGARTTTHSQQLSLETTDDAATYESQGSPNGVHGSPMQPTSGASTPTPTPPKRRGSSHDHGGSSSAIKRRRSSIVIDLASSVSANDGDGDTQSLVDQLLPYAEASDHSENDSSYGRPKKSKKTPNGRAGRGGGRK